MVVKYQKAFPCVCTGWVREGKLSTDNYNTTGSGPSDRDAPAVTSPRGSEPEGRRRESGKKTSRRMGHLGWAFKGEEEFSRQRRKDHDID